MDSDIQNLATVNANGDSAGENSNPSAACSLCGRIISSGTEATLELESHILCGDCRFLYLEDLETPTQDSYERRQAGEGRIGYSSSESVENIFSQQFSRMINLVRQNQSPVRIHENQPVDGDLGATLFQHSSSRTTPSSSSRWRRVLSDTESEGFDNLFYGESVSFDRYRNNYQGESDAVSFSSYAEESDISVDGQSIMGTGMFVQPGGTSDIDSDTDIDPMHVGMDRWNSDDDDDDEEDGEDSEWEDADAEEDATGPRAQVRNIFISSPSGSNGSINWRQRFHSPEFEGVIRWRFREDSQTIPHNIFATSDEPEFTPYMGNSGDYLDARGFEQFLEHLVETDVSRRGAPPASASFVKNLPRVVVKEEDAKHGDLACAICKDFLTIGSEVNQLPCLHLYHTCCIFPWLSSRNSCPLCRYELPTDDKDYEEHKHNSGNRMNMHEIERQDASDDDSSVASVEIEFRQGERELQVGNSSGQEGGRGRWFFLAAAPIVSLVGIVLVLWLGNPLSGRRSRPGFCNIAEQGQQHIRIPSQRENRNRRWWSLF